MRSTHLLTISSQAALSEADCTASRSDRLMHCKSFLTTSIRLRRGRPRGRRMSVVLIYIRKAWKEDDSSPSLTTWPNHSSLRCLQTWDSGVCSVLAYSAVFEIRCGYVIPMMGEAAGEYARHSRRHTSQSVCCKSGICKHSMETPQPEFQAVYVSCLILPALLYNCALWTLSQTLTDVVNVWHRKNRA